MSLFKNGQSLNSVSKWTKKEHKEFMEMEISPESTLEEVMDYASSLREKVIVVWGEILSSSDSFDEISLKDSCRELFLSELFDPICKSIKSNNTLYEDWCKSAENEIDQFIVEFENRIVQLRPK